MAGNSYEGELGEQLRAARRRAGHAQWVAAEKIECDHKAISEWETGKRKPHPKAEKKIRDYIAKYAKQLNPKQP